MSTSIQFANQRIHASARVKSTAWHPTAPWLALGLHSGDVTILDTSASSPTVVRSFRVSDKPVRAARFVPRRNWLVTGSDDCVIRVFDCASWALVRAWDAHADYIRSLDVHPTQPLLLSAGDDKLVKTWRWDDASPSSSWHIQDTFAGHSHYVMQAKFSHEDVVASAALDGSVRFWRLGETAPTLVVPNAHGGKGLNCLHLDADRVVTGADDHTVVVWRVTSQRGRVTAMDKVRVLAGHTGNVSDVLFAKTSSRDLVVSASEDQTVRAWDVASGACV
ncbi:hypothetical protein As57867_000284, partial [Aphanomyces stellatus]